MRIFNLTICNLFLIVFRNTGKLTILFPLSLRFGLVNDKKSRYICNLVLVVI